MTGHPDILIVGGGVIGLTTAYFLARDGARVAVVERGEPGREASWAGAGILPPGNPAQALTPFDRLRAQSSSMFPGLSAELREITGVDNGYLRCGGLEFADPEHAAAEEEWRGAGVAYESLDEPASRKLEPALVAGLGAATLLPDMAQVRNPRHVKALVASCQALGVEIIVGSGVHRLRKRGGSVELAETAEGRLSAGKYLIAAGAWSELLLEEFAWRPGIRPVRGQIALLNSGTPLLRRILIRGSRYIVPRADGRVLIGSTEEDVGFRKQTTASAIQSLLAFGISLVPALAEAPLEQAWSGLRPGSPDGLPFLGVMPDCKNLYVAAGHFRAGLQLSPGTGLVLKELILGQPLTVPLEPFRLDRLPHSGGEKHSVR